MDKIECCIIEECLKAQEKCNNFLVKCSSPNNLTIPVGTAPGTTYNVASLSLDLEHFCNPIVNLEYSSNIFSQISFTEINFQIFRQCRDQLSSIAVSTIWTYNSLTPGTDSSTFTFNSYDSDFCDCGCCTYTVIATITSAVETNPTIIRNSILDIFVTEKISC